MTHGNMDRLPQRKRLCHTPPTGVRNSSVFFLTVCCAKRGIAQLDRSEIFAAMTDAVEHYMARDKWWMTLFLALPDHGHAVVSFQEAAGMDKVVRDWKRFIAKATGVMWQDGFFEHRVRSPESANEKWHYIRLNPVRKGLVENPEDWPYVWMPKQVGMALDDSIGRRA